MDSVSSLMRDRVTIVWGFLVAATLLSFWLGADHGISSDTTRTAVILVVAFIKVRLIGLYFMELREAPPALRGAFEAYCLAACVTLIVFFAVA
ncbi:cytochrome C oxidase subunit IV family protein [Nocardia neocaledoniensis]|uniref:cytochrome C oxidase subunit IV family protein n=1 Tax=Nocardia neocaledoniensis TaxID=236511 RepID=UPI00245719F0|nr:cytochrome C oxidase subunit IV family protein [Nocardia neocaledoniensis]